MKLYLLPFYTLFLFTMSQVSYAQINLFACEPEWAALAKELGGNQLHITSATTAQQDPHHIQARPSLIAKIRRADMIACTGAELEVGWLPLLLRKSANPKIQPGEPGHFMATKQVSLTGKLAVADRSMGDVHAAGNPHIQFDPYRIAKVAQAMTARLIEIDPDNKAAYENNLNNFITHWQQSIHQWEQEAASLRGKSFVAHHESWPYLIKWLGLKQVAVLEPKPGVPPTTSHLSKVLAKTEKNPPDFIIYASYQSDKAAKWLSKKIGKPAISIPFSVSEDETLTHWYNTFIHQLSEYDK